MCGRFSLSKPSEAARRYGFVDWHELRIEPRFNIAPTQEIVTIVQRRDGSPSVQVATWGFSPPWLRPEGRKRVAPINARAETLVDSPLFRDALQTRRCLILADGFYEWQTVFGSTRRAPLYIRLKGGGVFAFGGLWAPGQAGSLPTAAIVTTRPNDLVAPIHNRMPVILRPRDEAVWLDRSVASPVQVMGCLEPYASEDMEAFPVSTLVNSADHDGPELLEPASSLAEALAAGASGTQLHLPLDD